jgi:transcriptional regulator with XRE-family HTH domain
MKKGVLFMNITINTNLKKLRQQKGSTQEDLAEYIGISFQAISKWERGEAFPDITLLPKIAAYYNVTVDDLLGVGKIRQKEKVEEYNKRAKTENALEVWSEAIQEIPNDLNVMCSYMYALPNDRAEEKISLAERLINESTGEENYTMSGLQTLCYVYNDLCEVEQAKKYAQQLPHYMVTWSQIMMSLLKGEEAVTHIQSNLMSLTDLIYLNIINMAREGNYKPAEKISLYEYSLKTFELLLGNDYGFYYDRTFDLYYEIASSYAELKDSGNTLKNLNSSAEHIIRWLNLSDNSAYKSLLVNRHSYGSNKSTATLDWLIESMQEQQFDFCRDDEQFKMIMGKLLL